ncbi:heat shock 70 kDa protein 12A-like isoform X2 [Mytilus trossulus]|uniref:heat shock 70 kDa protein 12A-like isoform X2 n=1 Tax=Mytilus trossulus TaxID=6551 RepID=UPI003003F73B
MCTAGCVANVTVIKTATLGIIEKFRRIGNDCGGTALDNRFLDLLDTIFGKSVMQSLNREAPDAHHAIIRECEQIKRNVEGSQDKIEMRVPYACLNNICLKIRDESLFNVISTSKYSNDIILKGDFLRIEADIVHTLFKTTINKIITLMEDVFTEYRDSHKVTAIVMIGGFSECMLVQEAVRQKFFHKSVIVSNDAYISMVKGAVECGSRSCQ